MCNKNCLIVPEFILEGLAKDGSIDAKETLHNLNEIQNNKELKIHKLTEIDKTIKDVETLVITTSKKLENALANLINTQEKRIVDSPKSNEIQFNDNEIDSLILSNYHYVKNTFNNYIQIQQNLTNKIKGVDKSPQNFDIIERLIKNIDTNLNTSLNNLTELQQIRLINLEKSSLLTKKDITNINAATTGISLVVKDLIAELVMAEEKRITLYKTVYNNAERHIYDCENRWVLRRTLARKEGDGISIDPDVNKAYNIIGFTRSYFKDRFNYYSFDNRGMDIIVNVNYGRNNLNAKWAGDEIILGDGNGKKFISFAQSIDVIVHEYMHGITQLIAKLKYYGQSGAIDEHYADVFAIIIKQRMLNQTEEECNWLIGDQVIGPEFPGIALRSMKSPGSANNHDLQPSHMDNFYTGSKDYGGVHINSGILNKAFYLASMKLGIDITEIIWFETLKELKPKVKFIDFFLIILRTTSKLIINQKIPLKSTSVIEESFMNVGFRQ